MFLPNILRYQPPKTVMQSLKTEKIPVRRIPKGKSPIDDGLFRYQTWPEEGLYKLPKLIKFNRI